MFKFLKRLRQKKDETKQAASSPIVEIQQAPATAPVEAVVGTAETTAASDRPAKSDPDLVSSRAQETPETEPEIEDVAEAESSPPKEAKPAEVVEVELPKRSLGDGIRSMFSSSLDIDQLEDILLLADFGVEAAVEITEDLRNAAKKAGATSDPELRLLLKDLLIGKLERTDAQLHLVDGKLPYVFLIVGVNGAGKTTTIGKLAKWLSDGEWEVVLGAADTFRAAAVEQLATWAERAGVGIIKPERDGQDPASVAYQTVERAIESEADIAIIDTAGRLQNKKDLMDELGKIRRAVEKRAQINEVLLVIDATTGQNALSQAKAFTEVAEVTGIVMTKLDGTAKGGILYTIQRELDIPVKLVGVGEKVDDFAFFSAEEFAKGLVARKS
jgi:fused signal recognition particle receptor